MPPRRKRAKTAVSTEGPSPDKLSPKATPYQESANANETALSNDGPNDTGLLGLPVELFDMIFETLWQSCRDCEDVTREVVLRNFAYLDSTYATKQDTLRSLSQVCRTLRAHFLPLLWEHVYACVVRREGGASHKILGERLQKLSKGLLKTPDVAQYVRVFSVSITKYQASSILATWADCLEILPNLHTVQIMCASALITTSLKKTFEDRKFPQIRTIVLPDCAHNFLRACPEVTEVICNEKDGGKLVTAIASSCKKVEVVQDILPEPAILKRLLRATPRLREYRIDCCGSRHSDPWRDCVSPDLLRGLSAFNDLAVLSVTVSTEDSDSSPLAHTTEDHVRSAKIALRDTKLQGPKRLCVNYSFYDRTASRNAPGYWTVIRTETHNV